MTFRDSVIPHIVEKVEDPFWCVVSGVGVGGVGWLCNHFVHIVRWFLTPPARRAYDASGVFRKTPHLHPTDTSVPYSSCIRCCCSFSLNAPAIHCRRPWSLSMASTSSVLLLTSSGEQNFQEQLCRYRVRYYTALFCYL